MRKLKKWVLTISVSSLGVLFTTMANVFANVQCSGAMYEPEVPDCIKDRQEKK